MSDCVVTIKGDHVCRAILLALLVFLGILWRWHELTGRKAIWCLGGLGQDRLTERDQGVWLSRTQEFGHLRIGSPPVGLPKSGGWVCWTRSRWVDWIWGGVLLWTPPPSLPRFQAGNSYSLSASLLIAQSQEVFLWQRQMSTSKYLTGRSICGDKERHLQKKKKKPRRQSNDVFTTGGMPCGGGGALSGLFCSDTTQRGERNTSKEHSLEGLPLAGN